MKDLFTAVERAHHEALANARRAIRAGDLAKAERWMKLSDLHWRHMKDVSTARRDMRETMRGFNARETGRR